MNLPLLQRRRAGQVCGRRRALFGDGRCRGRCFI